MVPFYIYYSMFGFQRVGDLVWAAGDLLARGFLLGGTAGRTSLNGEGLQHQDGHSHVHFGTVPSALCYDPAFAYEVAIIIREGLRRMVENHENVFYYITVGTDSYPMPNIPEPRAQVLEGVIKGMYRYSSSSLKKSKAKVNIMGSGAILNAVLPAREMLENLGVEVDIWSVTSYNELRREALDCEHYNLLHPEEKPRVPYITQLTEGEKGIWVATSDYMKLQPDSIRQWMPKDFISLGTDGFGRSDTRANLRDHFEVSARYTSWAAVVGLVRNGSLPSALLSKLQKEWGIDTSKPNPLTL